MEPMNEYLVDFFDRADILHGREFVYNIRTARIKAESEAHIPFRLREAGYDCQRVKKVVKLEP